MAESIVQDWLAEYDSLQADEMNAFVSMHENNQEIADAIYTIFNERLKYPKLIHEMCHQFLSFYRSDESGLKKFSLQFIPVLIYIYLNSVASGDKKNSRSVETLLICIYNGEISAEDDGSQRIVSFRMPILAQASVYHEEKSLSMTDMRRWEENSNRDIKWGPYYQIELINAQNRMKVMTALLFAYNQQLSLFQNTALLHLCRMASQIVNQGFSKYLYRTSYGSDSRNDGITSKPLPRIPLSAPFLVELVHAIYFAMFNGFGTIAIQTLEDIHNRACYEMFTELILVTSAVRNSLHANPSGQPSDGPMGLSVALTPATTTVTTVSKSMITNASFRTKKLPDDIPIQAVDIQQQQQQQQQSQVLTSISEEIASGEQQQQQQQQQQPSTNITSRNSIIRSSKEGIKAQAHKALIAGFKKSKDKDKDKDKDGKGTATATALTLVTGGGGVQQLKNSNTTNIDGPKEAPKPPTRKHEKHTQRNSLLQLQCEMTPQSLSPLSSSDFDSTKSPASIHKINIGGSGKLHYDNSVELISMQPIVANGSSVGGELKSNETELSSVGNYKMINNNNNNNNNNTNIILNNHSNSSGISNTIIAHDSTDSNCDAFDSLHSSMSVESSGDGMTNLSSSMTLVGGDEVQSSHL